MQNVLPERLDLLQDVVVIRPSHAGLDAFTVLGAGDVGPEAARVGDGSPVTHRFVRAFAHVSTPWSAVHWEDNEPGAQTVRPGAVGPVRGCLAAEPHRPPC